MHHDHSACDAAIDAVMPLAHSLARRYVRSSEPFGDLLQVASLGFVTAVVDATASVAAADRRLRQRERLTPHLRFGGHETAAPTDVETG